MRINEDFLDNIDAEDVKVQTVEPTYDQGHPDNATMYRLKVHVTLAHHYPEYIEENALALSRLFRSMTIIDIFPNGHDEDVIMEIEWWNDPYGVNRDSTIISGRKTNNINPLLKKMKSRDDLRAVNFYLTFWSTGCSDLDILKYKIRWRRIFNVIKHMSDAPINSGVSLNISDEWAREYELHAAHVSTKGLVFLDNMYKIIQDYEEP